MDEVRGSNPLSPTLKSAEFVSALFYILKFARTGLLLEHVDWFSDFAGDKIVI